MPAAVDTATAVISSHEAISKPWHAIDGRMASSHHAVSERLCVHAARQA